MQTLWCNFEREICKSILNITSAYIWIKCDITQLSSNNSATYYFTRNILDCNQSSVYSAHIIRRYRKPNPSHLIWRPENSGIEPNMKCTLWHIAKIHLKFSSMTTGSSSNGSVDPENPTLEPNAEWIGQVVAETILPSTVHSGVYHWKFCQMSATLTTWRHRSRDHWFRRGVPYRCSIVTMCLSCTVREIWSLNHFGITTLIPCGHVTSSVTWPLDPPTPNTLLWNQTGSE